MKQLLISEDLALPVDAATQTFLNVGKRGSGKSTTAARLVEQLLKAKVPVVVLDPVDTWFGLKSSRDGTGAGHDVYVFGGRHADLPLEAHGGALIADVLCEHRVPMILSCKHLSGLARSQFMVDFATTLYQKWNGGVLHLVLEEAHELAPQAPPKGERAEQMLGAFKRLWKLGRAQGIGGTAITQRPASLSKDITTQSEILIVHRTIGPQDVEAVRQWIKYRHQGEEILSELATLKTGEAFVWAPEFPEDAPIGLVRVQMLPRETFDSSATPKHGEQRAEPKALAAVDLERLRSKMAATIQRAKADDPKELRARIRQLEAEIKKGAFTKPTTDVVPKMKVREVPVVRAAGLKRLEAWLERYAVVAEKLMVARSTAYAEADRIIKEGHAVAGAVQGALKTARRQGEPAPAPRTSPIAPARVAPSVQDARPPAPVRTATASQHRGNGGARLGKGEIAILTAIAQHADGVTREQLSILTGYKRSTRDAYAQRLVSADQVALSADRLIATDAGVVALGANYQPLPTGDALREHWLRRLPEGERRVFEAVVAAFPDVVERDAITEQTEYKKSTRDAYLQRLSARRLVRSERGGVVASQELFG